VKSVQVAHVIWTASEAARGADPKACRHAAKAMACAAACCACRVSGRPPSCGLAAAGTAAIRLPAVAGCRLQTPLWPWRPAYLRAPYQGPQLAAEQSHIRPLCPTRHSMTLWPPAAGSSCGCWRGGNNRPSGLSAGALTRGRQIGLMLCPRKRSTVHRMPRRECSSCSNLTHKHNNINRFS
jgi:hypothetical protein